MIRTFDPLTRPVMHAAVPAPRRGCPFPALVLAFGLAGACGGSEVGAPAPSGAPSSDARPIPVEVAVAERGSATRTITATGTIEPIRTVTINSQLAGAVRQVAVEEGDVAATSAD